MNNTNNNQNQNQKTNKLRKFYKKHPKFRIFLDIIDGLCNWGMLISFIALTGIFLVCIIAIYITTPEDISAPSTVIVGGLLSIGVFPLIIDSINKRVEIQNGRYERLHDLYIDLSKHIISAVKENNNNTNNNYDKTKELSKFIETNYSDMWIDMPKKLNDHLLCLKEECDAMSSTNSDDKGDIKAMKYFAGKCIKVIRKQGNVGGDFYLDAFK